MKTLKRKISLKVQLVYIGLFILIICAMAAVTYAGTLRQLEHQVIRSNQNVLGQISKRIDSMLQEIDLTIINFLRVPANTAYFEHDALDSPQHYLLVSSLQDQIGNILGANFNMKSVMLYSKRSGKLVTASSYTELKDTSQWSWVRDFADGKQSGKWSIDPESLDLLLLRHYPLNATAADSSGVVITRINVRSISRLFDDLQFSDSYNAYLVDRDGQVISHKDAGRMRQPLEGRGIAEALSRDKSGYVPERAAGGKQLIFYDNSSYTGWKLIYIVTGQQLGAVSSTIRYILGGLAVLMMILAAVATRFVNHRWFTPMEQLIDRLEEMAAPSPGSGAEEESGGARSYQALHNRIEQVFQGYSTAEQKLREGKPALKLQVLFDVLTGSRSKFPLAQPLLEQAGVQLYPAHYIVLTMELDNKASLTKMADLNLYLYAFCNVAEEWLEQFREGVSGAAVQTSKLQAAVILSFAEDHERNNRQTAMIFAQELKDCIEAVFKRTVCIGMGAYVAEFGDIYSSYRESMRLIDYKIVVGHNAVITAENIAAWDQQGLLQLFGTVDALLESVRQANADKAHVLLEEMFNRAARSQLTKDMMVQLCLQVALKALHAAHEGEPGNLEQPAVLPASLESCETLREMRLVLEALLARIIAQLEERRDRSRTGELSEAVLAYVTAHYIESRITVNSTAEIFRITPNYLSKIFKDHTGCNFVEYLIRLRMETACRLLLESRLKLNDIAEKVGYTNFSSFLRNFKKCCGMTPTEYRVMHGGSGTNGSAEN